MKPYHLNGFKVDLIELDMNWFYIFGFFCTTLTAIGCNCLQFKHVWLSSRWAYAGSPNMSLTPCPIVLRVTSHSTILIGKKNNYKTYKIKINNHTL